MDTQSEAKGPSRNFAFTKKLCAHINLHSALEFIPFIYFYLFGSSAIVRHIHIILNVVNILDK